MPSELIERSDARPSAYYQASLGSWDRKPSPYGRGGGGPRRVREETPAYSYEDEDQSRPAHIELGSRVRHAMFGVGLVVGLEPIDGDVKLTVRFAGVGVKRLVGKYAKLELV